MGQNILISILSLLCSKCIHLIPHDGTLPRGPRYSRILSSPPKSMNSSQWQHLLPSHQPTEISEDISDLLTYVLLSISRKGCPLGPLEPYSTGGSGWGKFEGHTYKFTNISVSPSLWIPFSSLCQGSSGISNSLYVGHCSVQFLQVSECLHKLTLSPESLISIPISVHLACYILPFLV